ncbi:hypothetical protein HF313_15130 [Massilia atriviolacea]|uniref:Uncharacterized protein n=1 Tax=Massilia atriviolacea TaxID=2495579 RepID=A0A430HR97_9BURK|nr:hypothetical protein [Massilia atriviolacea]RSZ60045.1 hypothetical protein EJB06_07650 [Massilia atriviolacea]
MFSDPQTMGLLSAAAQMSERSGPSRQRSSIGQILGTGMGGYVQGKQAVEDRAMQQEQMKQAQMMREMQMKEMQAEMAQKERAQAEQARLQDFFSKRQMGGAQAGGGMQQPMQGGQPQPGAAPQQFAPGGAGASTPYAERMQLADELRRAGFQQQADAQETSALKFQPKVKNWQEVQVGGKVMYAPYYEDGNVGQPVPLEVARKLEKVDSGQSNDMIDPYTGQIKASIGKKQTLESLASNALTARGQNMTDSRARELNELTRQGQRTQIINDPLNGPMLIDKATGQARPAIGMDGQPVRGEQTLKREKQAQGLVSVIDSAEKLLDGATGSYAGASIDQANQFIGRATPGAQNIAQLKVLEGSIMMNQPRMEGPQSDKDVMLYRQMAGQIGDPTVPAALKKVALQSIKEINQRYAGGAQQQSASPSAPEARKSISLSDIAETARKSGRTTAEVTAAARARGYTIGGQ